MLSNHEKLIFQILIWKLCFSLDIRAPTEMTLYHTDKTIFSIEKVGFTEKKHIFLFLAKTGYLTNQQQTTKMSLKQNEKKTTQKFLDATDERKQASSFLLKTFSVKLSNIFFFWIDF